MAQVVNAAEISRLAGVGRAAVSNWRARYDDFPTPVGGSPSSPLYDLAEIEAWLATRGRGLDDDRRSDLRSPGGHDLANVMVSLLPGVPDLLLDPAVGAGTVLTAAAQRFGRDTAFVGQDPDRGSLDVTALLSR